MSKARKVIGGAISVLSAAALVGVAGTATASAADRDGVCNVGAHSLDPAGEFCLYYNSGEKGSLFDSRISHNNIPNLAGYTYLTKNQPGYGQAVKNNAASAYDAYYGESVYVFFNSNYMGAADFVPSLQKKQLVNTYNEDASYLWTE